MSDEPRGFKPINIPGLPEVLKIVEDERNKVLQDPSDPSWTEHFANIEVKLQELWKPFYESMELLQRMLYGYSVSYPTSIGRKIYEIPVVSKVNTGGEELQPGDVLMADPENSGGVKKATSGILYRGKPVEELSKEELLEALKINLQLYQEQSETVIKLGELARKR